MTSRSLRKLRALVQEARDRSQECLGGRDPGTIACDDALALIDANLEAARERSRGTSR